MSSCAITGGRSPSTLSPPGSTPLDVVAVEGLLSAVHKGQVAVEGHADGFFEINRLWICHRRAFFTAMSIAPALTLYWAASSLISG